MLSPHLSCVCNIQGHDYHAEYSNASTSTRARTHAHRASERVAGLIEGGRTHNTAEEEDGSIFPVHSVARRRVGLEEGAVEMAGGGHLRSNDAVTTLRIRLQAEVPRFFNSVSGIKTPGYTPAPCHIVGIFRPLPGSTHFKLN